MEKKQYNYCLDFIKGIACIFVVFMHCEFPGVMGTAVQAISRFCVPFFFMVSGYFCFRPLVQLSDTQAGIPEQWGGQNWSLIWKKIIHVGKITLYASLFYLAFQLLRSHFTPVDFGISNKQLFNWAVFNTPRIVAGQYWFLFALLYAYVIYGIFEHLRLRKLAYLLAALLFVVYIGLAQGLHLAGIHIPNMIYRNWLIEAFPYFMLGHWIHENQDKINIKNKTLLIVIAVTTLLCWVERWLMGRDFGVNIITIPQVFALFVYGIKNPTRHEGVIQRLGRDCSMLVYILHPAVWHSFEGIYKIIGVSDNMVALYMMPILVLLFSILFSLLFNELKNKFKESCISTNTYNNA